jgi:hypothetical protein
MSTALWTDFSKQARGERRRTIRAQVAFPVEVCGYAASGEFFTERAMTVNVSEDGCQLRLRTRVAPGRILGIRVIGSARDGEAAPQTWMFRAKWLRQDGNYWLLGAMKLDPESIWTMNFPAVRPLASAS